MGLKECGLNLSRDNKELKPHGTIDFPCAGYSSSYRDSEDPITPEIIPIRINYNLLYNV